jgi:hypothetical protein
MKQISLHLPAGARGAQPEEGAFTGSVGKEGVYATDGDWDRAAGCFWGGASRISSWKLSPNDLLQWAAMEKGAAKGLRVYNMCGYGYFKSKFGGMLEEPKRWHKSYSVTARWARRAYALYLLDSCSPWSEASRRSVGCS